MGMVLDEPKENDERFDDRGLTYLIDKDLLESVKPIRVDYVSSVLGSGFDISYNMQGMACGASCSC